MYPVLYQIQSSVHDISSTANMLEWDISIHAVQEVIGFSLIRVDLTLTLQMMLWML